MRYMCILGFLTCTSDVMYLCCHGFRTSTLQVTPVVVLIKSNPHITKGWHRRCLPNILFNPLSPLGHSHYLPRSWHLEVETSATDLLYLSLLQEQRDYMQRPNMEEDDYFAIIAESETQQGYLFEPEYTDEQLQRRDEEEAAAAAGVDEEERVGNDSWCLCTNCVPMETEPESLCCHEFHRAQFLLDELLDERDVRGEPAGQPICVTLHNSFGPHLDRHVLETYFRIPKINWKNQPRPAGPGGRLSLE